MPTPDPKTTIEHLTELKQRIDSLRTLFYYIESEFSHAFQSEEKRPAHDVFVEFNLLRQLLSRYVERRTEPDFLDTLIASSGDLSELDLGATRLNPLNSWLSEMARHEDDDPMDDCFVTWQQISKSFLSYIEAESRFVNESLKKSTALKNEREMNAQLQPKTDR